MLQLHTSETVDVQTAVYRDNMNSQDLDLILFMTNQKRKKGKDWKRRKNTAITPSKMQILGSCILNKEAASALPLSVIVRLFCLLRFGNHLALKPFGKLDSGNVNCPPKHICPPHHGGNAEACAQNEPSIEPIPFHSGHAVCPLLEMVANDVHGRSVHEVKGIRDLAKVLDYWQVEKALPSGRVARRNDENDSAR